MRSELPTGTVTLLFTDIEASTRLLHELGARGYAEALDEHRRVLRAAFAAHGGVEVDTQGDAFFAAFPTADGAVAAAAHSQVALDGGPLKVRMGLHTGTPAVTTEGYIGEDLHRGARVAALAHGGQVLLTDATRALLAETTPVTDLGLHRLKDFAAGAHLFQLGTASFPPLRTPGAIDLPTPATRFVGRERELYDAIAVWIDQAPRLLTVVGPGGTGKTRFALELARLLAGEAVGGTVFVPLAPLRDSALVLPTIAERLGAAVATPDGIAARVGDRRTHVLLDNLEQLLPDAARAIADVLAAAPAMRLIVTSRAPLRIQGEVELGLEPLDETDAVTLFLERARAVRPDVARTGAVDELCARLDRLPLALELAAARTKLLDPEELVARIGGALDLLRGSRDAEARHATLRATITWSHDLLDEEEQRAFAALSVFRSGWTLDGAEEVCGVDLDTIASLLDKSLVRRRAETRGERLWMLGTIREFARERLVANRGLEESVRRKHAERVLEIARQARLSAESQRRARADFARAHEELDEVRAAVDWALIADRVLAADIVTALEQLWVTSALAEGKQLAEALLAFADELPPLLRARLLRLYGGVVILLGERLLGERSYQEAIDIFEQLGDVENVRALAARFAVHAAWEGDPEEARQTIANVRRLNEAEPSPMIEAQLLSAGADLAQREGDLQAALQLYRESARVSAACGFRLWELWAWSAVADVELQLGMLEDAMTTTHRGLRLAAELRDERMRRWLALTLARALLHDEPGAAGVVWGALVEAEGDEPRVSLSPTFTEESADLAACASPVFADGVARGRALPLEQAVAEAQTIR
jgi:predicted ATPase/class 3 adenylate cyclase